MSKLYVFDLDGTLANIDHRLHFIHKKPKDYKSFLNTVDRDEPYQWVIDLLNLCRQNGGVLILTGREEITRDKTIKWLISHHILYDFLVMRKKGDYRSDTTTKPELLEDFLKDQSYEVQFIVDDRQKVVDKWRELGYNVLQGNKWEEHNAKTT